MVDFFEYEASSASAASVLLDNHVASLLTRCLCRDTLKDIIYKRVQNGHSLVGDTSIGMHLLQHYDTNFSQLKIK
jgi:hypothetical protein